MPTSSRARLRVSRAELMACRARVYSIRAMPTLATLNADEQDTVLGLCSRHTLARLALTSDCLAAAVRFVRKKQQLEMARALQVRDQVAAAVEKIQEFQAIFATLPGDAFCALEKLVPHEAL